MRGLGSRWLPRKADDIVRRKGMKGRTKLLIHEAERGLVRSRTRFWMWMSRDTGDRIATSAEHYSLVFFIPQMLFESVSLIRSAQDGAERLP